jgi:hypothetical protein
MPHCFKTLSFPTESRVVVCDSDTKLINYFREETLQVNVLSTTLLGLLLLSWMKGERKHRDSPAHLAFVSSGTHTYVTISDWVKWANENGGVLAHLSRKENWPKNRDMYAISKLLLMYSVEEIAKLALDANKEYVSHLLLCLRISNPTAGLK